MLHVYLLIIDAALTIHSKQYLQCLLDCFCKACDDFGLTISLKKTDIMEQQVEDQAATIKDYQIEVVPKFNCQGAKALMW